MLRWQSFVNIAGQKWVLGNEGTVFVSLNSTAPSSLLGENVPNNQNNMEESLILTVSEHLCLYNHDSRQSIVVKMHRSDLMISGMVQQWWILCDHEQQSHPLMMHVWGNALRALIVMNPQRIITWIGSSSLLYEVLYGVSVHCCCVHIYCLVRSHRSRAVVFDCSRQLFSAKTL